MTDEIFPGRRMVTKNDFIDDDRRPIIVERPYFLNPVSVQNAFTNVVVPPDHSRSLHSWDFPQLTSLRKQYRSIDDDTLVTNDRAIPAGEEDHHSSDHIVTQSYDVDDRKKYKRLATSGFFIAFLMFIATVIMSARTSFPAEQSLLRTIIFRHVLHPEPATKYWGSVAKPYPTGAFWTNLVVRAGDGAIVVYPYGVKTTDTGIQVSYTAPPHVRYHTPSVYGNTGDLLCTTTHPLDTFDDTPFPHYCTAVTCTLPSNSITGKVLCTTTHPHPPSQYFR